MAMFPWIVGITPLFGTYFLGGNLNGLNGIAPNTNDFMMIFNPTLATQALNVTYTNIGNNSFNGARVTTSQVTAAVPEPSTWLMMIFGFGAIGAALRRGRRTARLVQAA